MERRFVLLHVLPALAGGLAAARWPSVPARRWPLPPADRTRRLDRADQHHRQLHEIVRRWYRHEDAQSEAMAMLGILAQVWCDERGLRPLDAHGALALAAQWPDAATGVPWREAATAVRRLQDHANVLVPWRKVAAMRAGDVDRARVPLSIRDVARVRDVATRCDAAVRG